jgi:AraC-like DNA-binding protein
MPVLPLPLIVALVLAYLLTRAMVQRRHHPLLLTLIAATAAQGAVTALAHHYGVAWIRPLQPILAASIPPLAWLAFITSTQRSLHVRWDSLHALGTLGAALSTAFHSSFLDVLIPALFAAYGVALLVAAARHGNGLPRVRLESGDLPLLLWKVIAVALIASALCDVLIAIGFASGRADWLPTIVGIFSSLILLVLGLLALSSEFEGGVDPEADQPSGDAPSRLFDSADDDALLARLDRLMAEHSPYLDADLTLAKLARKLVVPAKQLSGAINRGRGENVSRYVNRFRIEHACRLILAGGSVTVAAFDSGFNTKSNFNREFLRVKQVTPSQWLASHQMTGAAP